MSRRARGASPTWTYVLAAVAAFMVNLHNLVVTTALPSIRPRWAPETVPATGG
jgi:hypothetical protein